MIAAIGVSGFLLAEVVLIILTFPLPGKVIGKLNQILVNVIGDPAELWSNPAAATQLQIRVGEAI